MEAKDQHIKHSPYTLEMFERGAHGTHEQQVELIIELSNTVNNLKWGFKKREASLLDQLETHKHVVMNLHLAHTKLQNRLKGLCSALIDQQKEVEDLRDIRAEHTEYSLMQQTKQNQLLHASFVSVVQLMNDMEQDRRQLQGQEQAAPALRIQQQDIQGGQGDQLLFENKLEAPVLRKSEEAKKEEESGDDERDDNESDDGSDSDEESDSDEDEEEDDSCSEEEEEEENDEKYDEAGQIRPGMGLADDNASRPPSTSLNVETKRKLKKGVEEPVLSINSVKKQTMMMLASPPTSAKSRNSIITATSSGARKPGTAAKDKKKQHQHKLLQQQRPALSSSSAAAVPSRAAAAAGAATAAMAAQKQVYADAKSPSAPDTTTVGKTDKSPVTAAAAAAARNKSKSTAFGSTTTSPKAKPLPRSSPSERAPPTPATAAKIYPHIVQRVASPAATISPPSADFAIESSKTSSSSSRRSTSAEKSKKTNPFPAWGSPAAASSSSSSSSTKKKKQQQQSPKETMSPFSAVAPSSPIARITASTNSGTSPRPSMIPRPTPIRGVTSTAASTTTATSSSTTTTTTTPPPPTTTTTTTPPPTTTTTTTTTVALELARIDSQVKLKAQKLTADLLAVQKKLQSNNSSAGIDSTPSTPSTTAISTTVRSQSKQSSLPAWDSKAATAAATAAASPPIATTAAPPNKSPVHSSSSSSSTVEPFQSQQCVEQQKQLENGSASTTMTRSQTRTAADGKHQATQATAEERPQTVAQGAQTDYSPCPMMQDQAVQFRVETLNQRTQVDVSVIPVPPPIVTADRGLQVFVSAAPCSEIGVQVDIKSITAGLDVHSLKELRQILSASRSIGGSSSQDHGTGDEEEAQMKKQQPPGIVPEAVRRAAPEAGDGEDVSPLSTAHSSFHRGDGGSNATKESSLSSSLLQAKDVNNSLDGVFDELSCDQGNGGVGSSSEEEGEESGGKKERKSTEKRMLKQAALSSPPPTSPHITGGSNKSPPPSLLKKQLVLERVDSFRKQAEEGMLQQKKERELVEEELSAVNAQQEREIYTLRARNSKANEAIDLLTRELKKALSALQKEREKALSLGKKMRNKENLLRNKGSSGSSSGDSSSSSSSSNEEKDKLITAVSKAPVTAMAAAGAVTATSGTPSRRPKKSHLDQHATLLLSAARSPKNKSRNLADLESDDDDDEEEEKENGSGDVSATVLSPTCDSIFALTSPGSEKRNEVDGNKTEFAPSFEPSNSSSSSLLNRPPALDVGVGAAMYLPQQRTPTEKGRSAALPGEEEEEEQEEQDEEANSPISQKDDEFSFSTVYQDKDISPRVSLGQNSGPGFEAVLAAFDAAADDHASLGVTKTGPRSGSSLSGEMSMASLCGSSSTDQDQEQQQQHEEEEEEESASPAVVAAAASRGSSTVSGKKGLPEDTQNLLLANTPNPLLFVQRSSKTTIDDRGADDKDLIAYNAAIGGGGGGDGGNNSCGSNHSSRSGSPCSLSSSFATTRPTTLNLQQNAHSAMNSPNPLKLVRRTSPRATPLSSPHGSFRNLQQLEQPVPAKASTVAAAASSSSSSSSIEHKDPENITHTGTSALSSVVAGALSPKPGSLAAQMAALNSVLTPSNSFRVYTASPSPSPSYSNDNSNNSYNNPFYHSERRASTSAAGSEKEVSVPPNSSTAESGPHSRLNDNNNIDNNSMSSSSPPTSTSAVVVPLDGVSVPGIAGYWANGNPLQLKPREKRNDGDDNNGIRRSSSSYSSNSSDPSSSIRANIAALANRPFGAAAATTPQENNNNNLSLLSDAAAESKEAADESYDDSNNNREGQHYHHLNQEKEYQQQSQQKGLSSSDTAADTGSASTSASTSTAVKGGSEEFRSFLQKELELTQQSLASHVAQVMGRPTRQMRSAYGAGSASAVTPEQQQQLLLATQSSLAGAGVGFASLVKEAQETKKQLEQAQDQIKEYSRRFRKEQQLRLDALEERDQLKDQLQRMFEDDYGPNGNNNSALFNSAPRSTDSSIAPMDSPSNTVHAMMGFVQQNKRVKLELSKAKRELADTQTALELHQKREEAMHSELENVKRRASMRSVALEAARQDLHKRTASEMQLMMQVEFLNGRIRAMENSTNGSSNANSSSRQFPFRS